LVDVDSRLTDLDKPNSHFFDKLIALDKTPRRFLAINHHHLLIMSTTSQPRLPFSALLAILDKQLKARPNDSARKGVVVEWGKRIVQLLVRFLIGISFDAC